LKVLGEFLFDTRQLVPDGLEDLREIGYGRGRRLHGNRSR
jgi:hypothetical protein